MWKTSLKVCRVDKLKREEDRQVGRDPSAKNAKLQVRISMFLNNKNDHNQTVVSRKSYETVENNDSYQEFVEDILNKNRLIIDSFTGGKVKLFHDKWLEITNDPAVLEMVTYYKIELSQVPFQIRVPNEKIFYNEEYTCAQNEISKLLNKKVIVECEHEIGEYISQIFLREKKDGSHRVSLNLKRFNEFVTDYHFKMETLDTVLQIMKPGAFAGSLDLKDAYYSVPIYADHTKDLKFSFNKKLYKFVALPNGLKSGPRVFLKIMRVAMSEMRWCGYESATYLDDVYLQANTRVDCQNNVRETAECLMSLGFVIHPVKSDPATSICHIGFLLNLTTMEIYLPPDKAKAVTMFVIK